MRSDTLSDLVKLNHGEFCKYHLCPSKIDNAHVYILFFKDKSIQNGPKVIDGALGHSQRPHQVHLWRVQQNQVMFIIN